MNQIDTFSQLCFHIPCPDSVLACFGCLDEKKGSDFPMYSRDCNKQNISQISHSPLGMWQVLVVPRCVSEMRQHNLKGILKALINVQLGFAYK